MAQKVAQQLALILEQHEIEIVTAWIAKIRQIPDSRYPELPPQELHALTTRGLAAIVRDERETILVYSTSVNGLNAWGNAISLRSRWTILP